MMDQMRNILGQIREGMKYKKVRWYIKVTTG